MRMGQHNVITTDKNSIGNTDSINGIGTTLHILSTSSSYRYVSGTVQPYTNFNFLKVKKKRIATVRQRSCEFPAMTSNLFL